MENLWWPGLTFLEPEDTRALIEQVHYEKKGFQREIQLELLWNTH